VADLEIPDALRDDLRAAWERYLDHVQPLRPALHMYCRRLTHTLWDAEDLVQDTLLRAFGSLGRIHDPVRSPRSYLLRTATNLWIDRHRRREREASVLAEVEAVEAAAAAPGAPSGELRDAGRRLLLLPPRERAAVLLKDVFELDLEESAEVLETTVGAVKAALHRARARLRKEEPPAKEPAPRPQGPSVSLVDRFVALFNAADRQGLLELLLDNATTENVGGGGIHWGREAHRGKRGWFEGALGGHPDWPAWFQFESQRMERAIFRGEPILLHFHTRRGRESLDVVVRLEEEDGRVSRLRSYGFCPETVREVAAALGVPVLTGIYRAPTP
jgi:RNA polymerase sigma-70 factor (ECF subfamily)